MEIVLPKPLSGTEVIEAILYDIRYALLRDDYFAPHKSFSGYVMNATLQIRTPSDEGRDRPLISERQSQTLIEAPTLDTATVTVERPLIAPNEVRRETDQPVPMQVTTPEGGTREVYKSYRGRDAKGKFKLPPHPGKGELAHGAAIPKNKAKDGATE
jgi:hypothetical protein